jgi:hypothetical protein
MPMTTSAEAQKRWDKEIFEKAKEIDPDDERDWFDMAYGFFLALGFESETASDMAWQAKGVGV